MENPFVRPTQRHTEDPAPPSSFQRELAAKMKDRRKRGLAVDVTPSCSERDSEEELASDDELMAGFNMTSKSDKGPWQPPDSRKTPTNNGKKSPAGKSRDSSSKKSKSPSTKDMLLGNKDGSDDDYDDEGDYGGGEGSSSMMMTMRQPWNPQPNKGKSRVSPKPKLSKSKALDSLNEEDEPDGYQGRGKADKPWQPPTFNRTPQEDRKNKENQQPQRPKSPSVRGRRTPNEFVDSLDDAHGARGSPRPAPAPRRGTAAREGGDSRESPRPQPRPRASVKAGAGGPDPSPGRDKPSPRYKTNPDRSRTPDYGMSGQSRDPQSQYGRRTPDAEGRHTPGGDDRRTGRTEGRRTPDADGRRTPDADGRRTPGGNANDRRTPSADGRRTPGGDGPRTPDAGGKRTPGVRADGRRTPGGDGDGRRTPDEGRRTPTAPGRKSPSGRHTPTSQGGRKTPTSASERQQKLGGKLVKKSSVEEQRGAPPEPRRRSVLDVFEEDSKAGDTDKPGKKKKPTRHLADSDSDDDRRRSPSPLRKGARTPDYGRGGGVGRKSPFEKNTDDGYRGYGRDSEKAGRGRSPASRAGAKSPYRGDDGHRDRRKSPFGKRDDDSRQSPFDSVNSSYRKGPFDSGDRRGHSTSPFGSREGGGRSGDKGNGLDAFKPSLKKNRATDFEDEQDARSAFRPTPTLRHRAESPDQQGGSRGRPRSRTPKETRESSVCRDVKEDPTARNRKVDQKDEKASESHTSEGRLFNSAINSVQSAQDSTMKFIDPDKEAAEGDKKEKEKPGVSTWTRHRPKPRYAKPVVESKPTSLDDKADFNSTTNIREAVFVSWYKERMQQAKKELEEKKRKEKEEEQRKKKAEVDKRNEAEASFHGWKEKKKDSIKELQKKKRDEQEKKLREEKVKEEQRKDSETTFKLWKEEKDARIRENQRKKQREEERKRNAEQDKISEKKKDSNSAFLSWKERKDDRIKKQVNEKKNMTLKEKERELEETRLRERDARKQYEKWLMRKERQQDEERERERQKRRLEEEEEEGGYRPAWSPANRTIPFGR